MHSGNWEFWLNLTNIALGVIACSAVMVLLGAIGWELLSRSRHRGAGSHGKERGSNAGSKAGSDVQLTSVGPTMADGGEPIKPPES